MNLRAGARLGPYEVTGALGSGGMGDVYRAHDSRLERDVAIKLLPPAFSVDPDRLRRFEQEARAAAALNHPGLLAVYDIGISDGTPYLVSELLEGETVRQRMVAAIPVRRVVDYGIQIAHALAAAHEKGIVHRDLKPENLFVTTDGRIKILDFGLAKLMPATAGLGDAGNDAAFSQTATVAEQAHTAAGILLGTIGYMAPEQARGHAVDPRADLFALGAILYEMLSGRRAFRGTTAADTIAAILHEDPPDLPLDERHIPPALARIVDRCLAKNPAARFGTAADLAFALEGLSTSSDSASSASTTKRKSPLGESRVAWSIAAVLLTAVLAFSAAALLRPVSPPPAVAVFQIATPLPPSSLFALSADGARIVADFAPQGFPGLLWLRSLDEANGAALAGTDRAEAPFWAPDGRSVAFLSDDKLRRVDLTGAPPRVVADAQDARGAGTWNRQDLILFAGSTGIFRVPGSGGKPEPVTRVDRSLQETAHRHPFFLPDDRHFLYTVVGAQPENSGIFVGALDSSERKRLVGSTLNAIFVPPAHLLFALLDTGQTDATLMAQRFDPARLELSGEPFPVARVRVDQFHLAALFSASGNGMVAYMAAPNATPTLARLSWYDRSGRLLGTLGEAGTYRNPRLSPDGTRVVLEALDSSGNRDLWVIDSRGTATRLTSGSPSDSSPVWSPDGQRIAWRHGDAPNVELYQKPSGGVGTEEKIPLDVGSWLLDEWTRDDALLLHSGIAVGGFGLRILPLHGGELQTIGNDRVQATHYRVSPDGRWVAFAGDYSGTREIYVQNFPTPTGRWRVSTGGGLQPVWRPDGRELFYLAPDGMLMAAPLALAKTAEPGAPVALFKTRLEGGGASRAGVWHQYDVSPDGSRFLVNTLMNDESPAGTYQPAITVAVNWRGDSFASSRPR